MIALLRHSWQPLIRLNARGVYKKNASKTPVESIIGFHPRGSAEGRWAIHVWMAPALQEIIWRAAQRSLAVMCPACWCSPGGLLALMGSANRVLIIQTGSMSR